MKGIMRKGNIKRFDLEQFITDDVNVKFPNFADDGMVEQTIFTERFYAHLTLSRYKKRIINDGKDFWFYDKTGCEHWKPEYFIGVKVWNTVVDHFRREELHYEKALPRPPGRHAPSRETFVAKKKRGLGVGKGDPKWVSFPHETHEIMRAMGGLGSGR